jgi:hypothetical protein
VLNFAPFSGAAETASFSLFGQIFHGWIEAGLRPFVAVTIGLYQCNNYLNIKNNLPHCSAKSGIGR